MRCELITPFRVPLNMPKHYIRAYPESWKTAYEAADKVLTQESSLENASLGNYGWARLDELQKHTRTLYGAEGIMDPGFFFKEHHLMLLSGYLTSPHTDLPELAPHRTLKPSNPFWECRIYDSNLAILILGFDVDRLEDIMACTEEGRETYHRWTDRWIDHLLAELCAPNSGQVDMAVHWLRQKLLEPFLNILPCKASRHWLNTCTAYLPFIKKGDNQDSKDRIDILDLEANPIYDRIYQRLWTHSAYSFAVDELPTYPKKGAQEVLDPLTIFLSDELLRHWRKHKGCYYGWGGSVRTAHQGLDQQWREAASVSQYYYTCLDIADTGLPMEIARQRTAILDGHARQVLVDTEHVSNRLQVIQNDYEDIRNRAASEAGRVLDAYHINWRMDKLLESIDKKLALLRQLTETASDNLEKKNDDMMSIILFIIGVLGLVSLFTGLHEYLSSGISTRFYDELPELALALGKSDVLMGSLLVILAALAAFFFYRRSR